MRKAREFQNFPQNFIGLQSSEKYNFCMLQIIYGLKHYLGFGMVFYKLILQSINIFTQYLNSW